MSWKEEEEKRARFRIGEEEGNGRVEEAYLTPRATSGRKVGRRIFIVRKGKPTPASGKRGGKNEERLVPLSCREERRKGKLLKNCDLEKDERNAVSYEDEEGVVEERGAGCDVCFEKGGRRGEGN